MANTYDLTQTGSEVQAILNDANNIKGAGAQTTLTTDYILLKDTNGQYHKILKDSFTEACRNVLAGLLVNNDKGTTISQIAAVASGDFGSVTPANLASVLGATSKGTISSSSNIDTVVDAGIYIVQNPSGLPSGTYAYGTLIVYHVGSFIVQNYIGDGIGRTASPGGLYTRSAYGVQSFSGISWVRTDNFGCATASDLASLLGGFANLVIMTNQDSITWDSLNSTCFVAVNGKNAGCPTTANNIAGFCIVSGTTGFQLAIPNNGDTNIYFRHRWGSVWQTWRKIPFTAAS